MITFKQYIEEMMTSGGGAVDMNPTGRAVVMNKRDKRRKDDVEQMYRRAVGLKGIRHILAQREA